MVKAHAGKEREGKILEAKTGTLRVKLHNALNARQEARILTAKQEAVLNISSFLNISFKKIESSSGGV